LVVVARFELSCAPLHAGAQHWRNMKRADRRGAVAWSASEQPHPQPPVAAAIPSWPRTPRPSAWIRSCGLP